MSNGFIGDNFLLQTDSAIRLYHEYASSMGIYDFHSHLPVSQIADDSRFDNISQVWLGGDHYKWRAMRTNGIPESLCSGDGDDREKFRAFAATLPKCLRNPLYHWSHLELKRYFDVDELLCSDNADEVYDHCNAKLTSPGFSVRGLMHKMNVQLVCSTDGPFDTLADHAKVRNDEDFDIIVNPTWRPDDTMNPDSLAQCVRSLEEVCDQKVDSFSSYIEALRVQHDYFHVTGCRLSDHGFSQLYFVDYTDSQIEVIFKDVLSGNAVSDIDRQKFQSAMIYELMLMNHEKGWAQQLHIGAMRMNNTRMHNSLGPDMGYDSIGDYSNAHALSRLLDRLDRDGKLAKTVLYNLNPADNEVYATMAGNFQDSSIPGKIQYGPAWWFLDQYDGMVKHMDALSSLGLLSRFVGMVTDSRSYLSFPRHEYFRRILCNILGEDMEKGFIPNDFDLVGEMVRDISYNNAVDYFEMI